MKKIMVKDLVTNSADEDLAKTGIILFKNKKNIDSIKFIDNLPMLDAISLISNSILFLLKAYEKGGANPVHVYDNFYQSVQQAFFQFNPTYTDALSKEETEQLIKDETEKIINKMKEDRPQPKSFKAPKGVIDPYEQ